MVGPAKKTTRRFRGRGDTVDCVPSLGRASTRPSDAQAAQRSPNPYGMAVQMDPLLNAARNGHLAELESLLVRSWPLAATLNEALGCACLGGHIEAAKLLLLHGAAVHPIKIVTLAPIYLACENGDVAIVKELLRRNARLDYVAPEGETLLGRSAYFGNAIVVALLLEKGTSIEASHQGGTLGKATPLDRAIQGHAELSKLRLAGDWQECVRLLSWAEIMKRRGGLRGAALTQFFWKMVRDSVRVRPYALHWLAVYSSTHVHSHAVHWLAKSRTAHATEPGSPSESGSPNDGDPPSEHLEPGSDAAPTGHQETDEALSTAYSTHEAPACMELPAASLHPSGHVRSCGFVSYADTPFAPLFVSYSEGAYATTTAGPLEAHLAATKARIHALFESMDTDGSGQISRKELAAKLRADGEFEALLGIADATSIPQVVRVMRMLEETGELDQDGDAHITREEFESGLLADRSGAANAAAERAAAARIAADEVDSLSYAMSIVTEEEDRKAGYAEEIVYVGGHEDDESIRDYEDSSLVKWELAGSMRPTTGTELVSEALSEALQEKSEFTHAEFDEFEVKDLCADSFVQVGDMFFRPVATTEFLLRYGDVVDTSFRDRSPPMTPPSTPPGFPKLDTRTASAFAEAAVAAEEAAEAAAQLEADELEHAGEWVEDDESDDVDEGEGEDDPQVGPTRSWSFSRRNEVEQGEDEDFEEASSSDSGIE